MTKIGDRSIFHISERTALHCMKKCLLSSCSWFQLQMEVEIASWLYSLVQTFTKTRFWKNMSVLERCGGQNRSERWWIGQPYSYRQAMSSSSLLQKWVTQQCFRFPPHRGCQGGKSPLGFEMQIRSPLGIPPWIWGENLVPPWILVFRCSEVGNPPLNLRRKSDPPLESPLGQNWIENTGKQGASFISRKHTLIPECVRIHIFLKGESHHARHGGGEDRCFSID